MKKENVAGFHSILNEPSAITLFPVVSNMADARSCKGGEMRVLLTVA